MKKVFADTILYKMRLSTYKVYVTSFYTTVFQIPINFSWGYSYVVLLFNTWLNNSLLFTTSLNKFKKNYLKSFKKTLDPKAAIDDVLKNLKKMDVVAPHWNIKGS